MDCLFYQNVQKFQYVMHHWGIQLEQTVTQEQARGEGTRPTHPLHQLRRPGIQNARGKKL